MRFNIYWKFWFAFFWRTWAAIAVIVMPIYVAVALYRGEAQTAIQDVMGLVTFIGPFIQVAVLQHIFTHKYKGFKADLTNGDEPKTSVWG